MSFILRPQSAIDVDWTSLYKLLGCIEFETLLSKISPCFKAPITISEQYHREDIPNQLYAVGLGRIGDQYRK